jgi:hypothetical protein
MNGMVPTKVTLEQSQIDFLAQFKDLGFQRQKFGGAIGS